MKRQLIPYALTFCISQSLFAQGTNTLSAENVSTQTTKKSSTSLTLTPALYARSMEDKFANSKFAGGTVNVAGDRAFGGIFKAKLDLDFFLTTGSFTNQYSEEGKAPTAMLLNQAYVTMSPSSYFDFDAGVIATSFSSTPSLWEANGFPSLRQTLKFEAGDLQSSLYAVQAIPTSDTRTVKTTENGVNTGLQVVGLNLEYGTKKTKGLSSQLGLMRFQFQNLNSSAAVDSQYLGNTVVAPGPQARFKYSYAGTEVGTMLAWTFANTAKLSLSGAFLRNDEAPVGNNKGYTYMLGVAYPIGNVEIQTSGGYFYNESDTLPATYATVSRGYNNRFGQRARFGFKNLKDNVSGFIQYTRANEIEDKAFTADRDYVVFVLEVPYEIL